MKEHIQRYQERSKDAKMDAANRKVRKAWKNLGGRFGNEVNINQIISLFNANADVCLTLIDTDRSNERELRQRMEQSERARKLDTPLGIDTAIAYFQEIAKDTKKRLEDPHKRISNFIWLKNDGFGKEGDHSPTYNARGSIGLENADENAKRYVASTAAVHLLIAKRYIVKGENPWVK